MFGFRKKKSVPNPMWDKIHDNIRYEIHHNNDEERPEYADKYEGVPLLPRGTRNNSIPHDLYLQIDEAHRMFWHKIDLDSYFEQEGVKDIDTISRTAIDVRLLSYDLDLTKKADNLGIKTDRKYSDEVGL